MDVFEEKHATAAMLRPRFTDEQWDGLLRFGVNRAPDVAMAPPAVVQSPAPPPPPSAYRGDSGSPPAPAGGSGRSSGGGGSVEWLFLAALGNVGPDAKAAVPSLVEALQGKELCFRAAAIEALKKVDPETATKAGVQGL